ncbi:MAG: DUF302 domain-containing protein [Gammaproteobacteria bacterium]|nr:DUF302 domain-containing protein [Gammaproteobacteria bacterium]
MSIRNILIALSFLSMTCLAQAADLVKKPSAGGVQETMDKLEAIVKKKGLTVFNRIDHQLNARQAGMDMAEAQLLVFGNPKMGTAMMKQDTAAGLDLPLRVLVFQDKDKKTWISYHNPQAMKKNFQLEGNPAVDKATKALGGMTDAASK